MRKIFAAGVIFCVLFSYVLPFSEAVSLRNSQVEESGYTSIEYPSGGSFEKLKTIIDSTFTLQTKKSYGNCISSGWLCPNYKYTSLSEKAIKYIVLDTYEGNEDFYKKLLSSYSNYEYDADSGGMTGTRTTSIEILRRVPKGTAVLGGVISLFPTSQGNIASELMDASFGLDFTENASSNSMLGAIEQKIKDLKVQNCRKANLGKSTASGFGYCAFNQEISNRYLPTEEELYKETIYFNRGSVKIESLKDEFEYVINQSKNELHIREYPQADGVNQKIQDIRDEFTNKKSPYDMKYAGAFSIQEFENLYFAPLLEIRKNPTEDSISSLKSYIQDRSIRSAKEQSYYYFNGTQISFFNETLKELDFYGMEFNGNDTSTYSLRYKKNTFTLEEAKAKLEKGGGYIYNNNSGFSNGLPCLSGGNQITRSQCATASANMNTVMTALSAYYSDKEVYPESIDSLDKNYISQESVLQDFKKNFEYRSFSGSSPNFEIKYIGNIGEGASIPITDKKDYVALMSGATIPEIPAIFSHVPKDSMVLYIKNPQDLFDLLSIKSNTTTRISGIDVSDTVKKTLQNFFELKDFTTLEQNLKHELALVIDNLDMTTPDITMILSEADRAALSPTAKARVVGSKDGFIYIASSKTNIDRMMNLEKKNSLADAPDFHYVWWKKSSLIRDAFFFVGDAFFEKMLSFETYIAHYRKIHDVEKLSMFQELSWAYEDVYGKNPENLEELIKNFQDSRIIKDDLAGYTIVDGNISDPRIGSIKSLKTLSEVNYDLSKITRAEIEDYKINILKYRDTWRASLDPMGIILNRYGDGMEVDFFMTPIPNLSSSELSQAQSLFEGVTKDSLSFLTNPHIRMGLLSFVIGLDPKKLEQKINANEEIGKEFTEFSREVLDGKDIFDYLGGEGAFSLGNFPSDILDGWNIEKIDAYFSIQVMNEEKGKELIDILRKKIMDELGDSKSSGFGDIRSFLTKPLIEDYANKKIYYVEAIPVPFVGKIGFAYTFVDDFFFLAPNRTTIRRIIDTAAHGDKRKEALIDKDTAQKGSFFLTLFDGESASNDLRGLYEKNKSSIPRYASYIDDTAYGSDSITPIISKYYTSSIRNKRLGRSQTSFSYILGGLHIQNKGDTLQISLDEKAHVTLSGTTLQMWNNLISEEKFPKEIFSESGITLEKFMANDKKGDILAVELIMHLDSAFASSESLFRNLTFSLSMGDNEIGFNTHVFRQKDLAQSTTTGNSPRSKDIFVILGVVLFLLVLSGVVVVLLKKKKSSLPISPIVTPLGAIDDHPIVNSGVAIAEPSKEPRMGGMVESSIPPSMGGSLTEGVPPLQVVVSSENITLSTVEKNISKTSISDTQTDTTSGNQ